MRFMILYLTQGWNFWNLWDLYVCVIVKDLYVCYSCMVLPKIDSREFYLIDLKEIECLYTQKQKIIQPE